MTLKKLFFTHSGRAGKLYIKKLGSINAQIKLWSLKKESCKSFSKPRFKENFCLRQSWQRKQKRGVKEHKQGNMMTRTSGVIWEQAGGLFFIAHTLNINGRRE